MTIKGAPRRKGAGRPPKPTALKLNSGNPGRRPLNLNEPQYSPLAYLGAPKSIRFSKYAVDKWDYIVRELVRENVITEMDIHNLEQMCYWLGVWHDAASEVKQDGLTVPGQRGGLVAHPAIGIAAKASSQVSAYGSLLGLDPSSRQRIIGTTKDKTEDKWAAVLGGD